MIRPLRLALMLLTFENFPPGTPIVAKFLADLAAVGTLTTIPVPESCGGSVSFGTSTFVTAGGEMSGDLECLMSATAAQTALVNDCAALCGCTLQ